MAILNNITMTVTHCTMSPITTHTSSLRLMVRQALYHRREEALRSSITRDSPIR
jgi:hypothetical protein